MILFLILLYILGLATTIINLSLLKRWWSAVAIALAVSVPVVIAHPFCAAIGGPQLQTFLHDPVVITNCALVQIIESFIMLVLSCRYIVTTYSSDRKLNWSSIGLAPSLALIAGNMVILTLLFGVITGKSFILIAILVAACIFAVLIIGKLLFPVFVRSFDAKVKGKILISFLQILLAMFLPLLAAGIETIPYPIHSDIVFTLIITSGMASIASIGYIINRYLLPLEKKGNKLCRFLIKVCT